MHDFRLLRLDREGHILAQMDSYDDPAERFLGLHLATRTTR